MHPSFNQAELNHRITIRKVQLQDGRDIWKLVKESGTLDVNSVYCYLMLCEYFPDTCFVAELNGQVVGFVTAFLQQNDPEVLFVWQIAVSEAYRGMGIADSLLERLTASDGCKHVRYIQTTVAGSNAASRRVFAKLAEKLGADQEITDGLPVHLFPEAHEAEPLIRIGPIRVKRQNHRMEECLNETVRSK